MEHGSEFISQLTSVKEPAKLMELQSEYAKNAYETFVAETKRISNSMLTCSSRRRSSSKI